MAESPLTRADLESVLAKIPKAIGDELDLSKHPVNVPKVDALEWLRKAINHALPYLEST